MDYYIHLDDRIKYHRFERNVGVCEARNFGNQTATADLICVSDQDDLSDPRRAIYSYSYMTKHPDIDCLTSYYYECNVDGIRANKCSAPQMDRATFEDGHFTWYHSSACYRKQDILALPYKYADGVTDDWQFLDDWTKAGKKFHTTKAVLGYCRRLPWGVMQHRRAMQGMEPSYIL